MARNTRGRRTDYNWEAQTLGTGLLGVATGSEVSQQVFTFVSAGTLMRVRGNVMSYLDASGSAAGDACVVAMGLLIVSAGATIVASPLDEGSAPWLWHQMLPLGAETAVGNVGAPSEIARVEVDSKAMRRVKADVAMSFLLEVQDVAGAPITNTVGGFRVLTGQ